MNVSPISAASAQPAPAAAAFDRDAWKADFERVKLGLAQGYANLDWQIDRRGFNLKRASQQITAMLDRTNSDAEAAVVLAKLVDAFKDPHLQLQIGPPPDRATLLPLTSSVDGPAAAQDRCSAAHYSAGNADTRLAYVKSPEWKQTSEGPFLSGVLGDIGILRIPAFGEDRYLDACNKVAKPGMEGRALQLATRAELNRELIAQIAALRKAGARKLIIDVTGNGGGTEWSNEVAAMLATGTLKRPAPRLAGPTCDRSSMWDGKRPCPIYGKPAEIEEMEGTGIWNGPLAVLTDRRSASATEELVTWLKDNGKAVIAGERTHGSGCGYVDGGYAIALKAANLHIMVPNCSRYTSDGINEIEGIAPDVPIDWGTVEAGEIAGLLSGLFEPR